MQAPQFRQALRSATQTLRNSLFFKEFRIYQKVSEFIHSQRQRVRAQIDAFIGERERFHAVHALQDAQWSNNAAP